MLDRFKIYSIGEGDGSVCDPIIISDGSEIDPIVGCGGSVHHLDQLRDEKTFKDGKMKILT